MFVEGTVLVTTDMFSFFVYGTFDGCLSDAHLISNLLFTLSVAIPLSYLYALVGFGQNIVTETGYQVDDSKLRYVHLNGGTGTNATRLCAVVPI